MFTRSREILTKSLLLMAAFLVAGFFLQSFGAQKVSAAINNTINFQSKIVNKTSGLNISAGSPACVSAGADTCDFRIRVWNQLSGGSTTPVTGNLMYEELFTNVEIGDSNGIFNLTINSVCSAANSGDRHWGTTGASSSVCVLQQDSAGTGNGVSFDRQDLYIEVTFDPSGAWTTLASPPGGIETFSRLNLKSVPSAFVAQTLSGIGATGFVQFAPSAAQTTSSTNSLINLETTANTSNPIQILNENGAGTPNLLELQVAGIHKLRVDNNGTITTKATISNGSTTTTGTGSSTKTLTVTSSTNFDVGNLILLNGATWTHITNITNGTTIKVNPAVSWAAGETVVEYTTADVGSSSDISQRYGTGYFLNGITTGAASTLYADELINSASGALNINTTNNQNIYFGSGNVGIGTVTPTSQFQVQVGTVTSGGVTMSGTNGGTTVTTSATVTLNAGDYLIPTSQATQARVVTVGGTGTSFTVSPAFSANVTNRTYTISKKVSIEGPRPLFSLKSVLSPFTTQEWQLRVGASTPSSQAFEIFDQTANATRFRVESDGNTLIGTDTNAGGPGNQSRLFVYGGAAGANIDVMGNPAISDQATIELEGSDYITNGDSVRLQYYGPNGIGTTFGFSNQNLGVLGWSSASTAIIGTNNAIPIIIATDNVERARFDASGNLAIGVTTATAFLDVAAATTGKAAINLTPSAGVNPSAPNSGDLWWNGTNLNFYTGSSTIDLVAGSCSTCILFAPASAQTTTSTNSLINIATTATTSNTLFVLNENGSGTPNLLDLQVGGVSKFKVANAGEIGLGTQNVNPGVTGISAGFTYASPSAGTRKGSYLNVLENGNAPSAVIWGSDIDLLLSPGNGNSVASGIGSNIFATLAAGGTASLKGLDTRITNSGTGTLGTSSGLYVETATNTGGGTITNNYGLYIENQTAGTTDYGVYVSGADTYAIWADNGDSRFDGNVLAGTTTSTAFINLAASTTAKASARFISSAGVNPSAPNSGDLWWNGTNFNFYNGSSSVDLLAFNNAGGANGFVQYAPASQQTTSSTNSLINLATTGNTSNALFVLNENGAGTPDLLNLKNTSTTVFGIGNDGDIVGASQQSLGSLSSIQNLTTFRLNDAFAAASGDSAAIDIDLTRSGTLSATTNSRGIYNKLFFDVVENGFNGNGYAVENIITVGSNREYNQAIGARNAAFSTSTASSNQDQLIGSIDEAIFSGTGLVTNSYGVRGRSLNNSSGTITNAYGAQGVAFTGNASANITNAYGLYGYVHEGTGGTIATGYGVYSECDDATTCYGLYFDGSDPDVVTSWGLYLNGVDKSYFDGTIGVGVLNPDAYLDIKAATASSAQVNLTSSAGVNPTTPNSGDLWWNGTNLNFYNGSSTIDLLASGAGFVQLAPASAQTSSSANTPININSTGGASNLMLLANTGASRFIVSSTGTALLGNGGSISANSGLSIFENFSAVGTANGIDLSIQNSTNTSVNGISAQVFSTASGGVTPLATGLKAILQNASVQTITAAYAGSFRVDNIGGGTTVTSAGVFIDNGTNAGAVTNNYGLLINNQTQGSSNYGIWVNGGSTEAVHVTTGAVGAKGVVVMGVASQTANLLETQTNTGVVLGTINSAGAFSAGPSSTTRIQASGSGTGSAGSGSIYFLDSSGISRGRVDTVDNQLNRVQGDGTDGAITIAATANLNTTPIATGRVTFGDGIAYRVNPPGNGDYSITRFSSTDTISNGLTTGDEVLLIDLQGNTTGIATPATAIQDIASVGNYEFLIVESVSASQITFTTPVTARYVGINQSAQRVVIQRVPQYTNVTINSGGTLTASAYEGLTTVPAGGAGYLTGIVAFRANGTITVNTGGAISADALGYRGGAAGAAGANGGSNGESYDIAGNNTAGRGGSGASNGQTLAGGSAGNGPVASPADQYPRGGGGGGGSNGSASAATNGSGGAGGGGYGGGGGGGGGGGELNAANNGGTGGTGGTTEVSAGGGGGGRAAAAVGTNGGNAGSAGGTGTGTGGAAGSGITSASGGGGGNATTASGAGGGGGGLYGNPTLTNLFYGSGGGGGAGGFAVNTAGAAGGNGGGIIFIGANTLTMAGTGTITSDGANATNGTAPASGGGGGAGGSIRIEANTATLGTSIITATGGAVGTQAARRGAAGAGGVGRIYVEVMNSISGTTNPSATTATVNNYGVLHIGKVDTSNADLAEFYVAGDPTIEAGDVVSISNIKLIDDSNAELVSKGVMRKTTAAYDSKLLGIISTAPGIELGSVDGGSGNADNRALALSGRVPVKIDPDSEPIAIGDFLTSSAKPGYAKKATQEGYTIGKALEYWNKNLGKSKIMTFVNLGFYNGGNSSSQEALASAGNIGLAVTGVTPGKIVTSINYAAAGVPVPNEEVPLDTVTGPEVQGVNTSSNIFSFGTVNSELSDLYNVGDAQLGDVVNIADDGESVAKSGGEGKTYDNDVFGIVSTNPSLLAKTFAQNDSKLPISVLGKVISKVSNENGDIKKGDYLTSSSIPGIAMKATGNGTIIGRALESFPLSSTPDSELVKRFITKQKSEAKLTVDTFVKEGKISEETKNAIYEKIDMFNSEFTQGEIDGHLTGRILISENIGYMNLGLVMPKSVNTVDNVVQPSSYPQDQKQNQINYAQIIDQITNSDISFTKFVSVKDSIEAKVYKNITGLDLALQITSAGNSFRVIDLAGDTLFAIDSKGKISLRSGDDSSIGDAVFAAQQTEVIISNKSVTNGSQIHLTPSEFVFARVKSIDPGVGFTIELNQSFDKEIKVNYLIIN